MKQISSTYRQFFSALLILSVSFGQVLPLWANPELSRRTLRPEAPAKGTPVNAGLEEALNSDVSTPSSGVAVSPLLAEQLPYLENSVLGALSEFLPQPAPDWAVPPQEIQNVSQILRPYALQYGQLPETVQNVPAFVRHILKDLQQQQVKQHTLPFQIPSEKEVDKVLTELEKDGPEPGCACWVRATINYFGDPQRQLSELAQTEAFNSWEQLLGLGLVTEWLLNGKLTLVTNPADNDVTPQISLAALQVAVNAVAPLSTNFPWLLRREMNIALLRDALKKRHGVLAFVGGDHVVSVEQVTDMLVVYQDALGDTVQRKTHKEFEAWWNQGSVPGIALTTAPPSRAELLLSVEQAKQLPCGCGAYINTVRSGGIAAALLALMKFEYRGRDNAGLLWLDETGAHRWISIGPGAVRNLIRRIYNQKEVKEDYEFGVREDLLQSARRRVIEMQGLGQLSFQNLEGTNLNRLFLVDEEGNDVPEDRRVNLTLGNVGSMRAGAQYSIDDRMRVVDRVANDYVLHPDIVKMFIRFELEKILDGNAEHLLVRAFDQLIDRVQSDKLNSEIQVEVAPGRWVGEVDAWREVLRVLHRKLVQQRLLTVPAVFNRDIVRQSFRMQAAIIGAFRVHSEWSREVEKIFNRRLAEVNKGRLLPLDWLTRWKEEKAANLIGQAFEAFNEWAHSYLRWMGRIHEAVWEREGFADAYARIDHRKEQPTSTEQRQYDADDRLMGRFDGILAELIGESIPGHGRWGMSGGIFIEVTDVTGRAVRYADPAHPHSDPEGIHWVTHNGQVDSIVYGEIREEHDQAGISYLSENGLPIGTDTRQISNHWYYVVELFRQYYDGWKKNPSPESLHSTYDLPIPVAERYNQRFKQWDEIAAKQLENQGLSVVEAHTIISQARSWDELVALVIGRGLIPPWTDEIAHRVSTLELAQRTSQLGVTTYSAHDPFTQRAVSHRRELAIDVWNGMATISSDDVAGLSLFPPQLVEEAARQIREVKEGTIHQVTELWKKVTEHPDPAQGEINFLGFLLRAQSIYQGSLSQIAQLEAPFEANVYYLRGPDNYAKVWKEIDKNGKPVLRVEVTTLDGKRKDIHPERKIISPSVADKGSYATFTDAHFNEVPWIALQLVLRYMSVHGAQSLEDIRPAVGSDPSHRTPMTPGVHWEFLEKQFGGASLPELIRIFLGGVGSAELNVLIAAVLGEAVLPSRVDLAALDSALASDLISSGYLEMNPHDMFVANTQSGTTASTEEMLRHAEEKRAAVVANTGSISKAIPARAQKSGGAIDILAGQEITTAAYKAFLAQNITLFLFILEMARRMGTPREILAPYERDILRLPQLLTEATESVDYRTKADRAAQASRDHNKSLVIGSANNPFMGEVGLKDREVVWRPVRVMDYRDDIVGPLQSAARDKKTTVYIWATDPSRLEEANAVIQLARELGLQPIVVTLHEENPFLPQMEQATPFTFLSPRLTGVLQAIVDNPIIMHLIRSFTRVKGRSDEEVDFLRNLAKSVVVFSFAYDVKKFVLDPRDFLVQWGELLSGLPEAPSSTYQKWRQERVAQTGLEEASPQLAAITDLPFLVDEIGKILADPNGVLETDVARNLRQSFGSNLDKLRRIVIVTDQEPLKYSAREMVLDYPELLGIQVNDVKVVRPQDPAVRRYINENSLVILLYQSQRDFSDRRISPQDSSFQVPSFQNEAGIVSLARELQREGVSVLTISDQQSGLVSIGQAGIGSVRFPEVGDTAIKLVADLCLDSVGVLMGRMKFESGERRRRVEDRAEALRTLPEFLAHHAITNVVFQEEVRQAAAVVARYDKHIFAAGAQAEQSADEGTRALSNAGEFGESERSHSLVHGPLTVADNQPSKYVRQADGSVVIRPDYNAEIDTVWTVFLNGNQPMAADDVRNLVTRNGVVLAVVPQHLSAPLESGTPKNLGALRVIHVPDVPQILIKYINHVVVNFLVYELARHHSVRSQVEEALSGGGIVRLFHPFVGRVTEMIVAFQTSRGPQFVPVPDPADTNRSFLFLIGEDRVGLARDVWGIIAEKGVSILEQLSPKPAGYGGVMMLRLDQSAHEIEKLRSQVIGKLTIPSVETFPGVSTPTPTERLDMMGARLSEAIGAIAVRASQGLIGAALKEGITGRRYADLPETQRNRLEDLAHYVSQIWAPQQVQEVAAQYRLDSRETSGRSAVLSIAGQTGTDAWFNALENIKAALTGRYNGASEESGALSYVVYGPGLFDLGDPAKVPQNLYARVIATFIPPDQQGQFATINPLIPIGGVESFLQRLAQANGRPLKHVRVVTLPRLPRSRLYVDQFTALANAGKIRYATPQDGTVEWGLRSNLKPAGPTDEVVVMMATARLPQALATLALSAGMPKGAYVSIRLLPDAETMAHEIGGATPEVPIGGASTFNENHRKAVTRWIGNKEKADALLRGQPITTLDIKNPVGGVLVPLTPLVSMPIHVEGVTPIPDTNRVNVFPIRVQGHKIWVQPMEMVAEPLSVAAEFNPQNSFTETSPVEISLRAQRSKLSEDDERAEEEILALIAAYEIYSRTLSSSGRAPSHTEIADFTSGGTEKSKLFIVAPFRLGSAAIIQNALREKNLDGTVTFAEEFRESPHAPPFVLAVAEVNASPLEVREKGIEEEIAARFRSGLEEESILSRREAIKQIGQVVQERRAAGKAVDLWGYRDPGKRDGTVASGRILDADIERVVDLVPGGSLKVRYDNKRIEISPASSGLEELPYDVVGAIRSAIAQSSYLKTIQEVVSGQWKVSDQLVDLTQDNISQLERQGNKAQDWSRIQIARGTDLTKIWNNYFRGQVLIGRISQQEVLREILPGVELPIGIYDSTIIDSLIGANVLIYGNSIVANQAVKEDVVIVKSTVTASGKTAFGNKTEIPVAIETGGREVSPFADMLLDAATRLAKSRSDKTLLLDYGKAHQDYVARATSPVGIIEEGARIINTKEVLDVFVGARAQILNATAVRNSTLLSAPGETTKVTDGAIVENSILQWGSSVESNAQVRNSVLLEHSHAERSGLVTDSILGPNTGVAEGEVTASLVGPFVGFHHQSLLIAALWPEGKGNVAYGANVGSNHTGKAPDQEIWPGEGTFFGLGSNIKYPSDFTGSPYSFIASGVETLPQRVAFPFSLINKPSESLPSVSPAFNEIIPAWLLTDNLYTLKRNEGKYKGRDKSRRHHFDFTVFRPDTVDLMKDARARLQAVLAPDVPRPVSGYYLETPQEIPIPGGQPLVVPGIKKLGKNYMKVENVPPSIDAYSRFILHYSLRGFYEQVKALAEAGQIAQANNLLTQASSNPIWEHQRQTLLEEWSDVTLRSGLRRFVELERKTAKDVERSKTKDDDRGERIIVDYAEAHTPAREDKFVKTMWVDFRTLKSHISGTQGLIAQLTTTGLEETTATVTSPEVAVPEAVTVTAPVILKPSPLSKAIMDVALIKPAVDGPHRLLLTDSNLDVQRLEPIQASTLLAGVVVASRWDKDATAWDDTPLAVAALLAKVRSPQDIFSSYLFTVVARTQERFAQLKELEVPEQVIVQGWKEGVDPNSFEAYEVYEGAVKKAETLAKILWGISSITSVREVPRSFAELQQLLRTINALAAAGRWDLNAVYEAVRSASAQFA